MGKPFWGKRYILNSALDHDCGKIAIVSLSIIVQVFIVGFGNIGIDLAKRLRGFGVTILATKRTWPQSKGITLKTGQDEYLKMLLFFLYFIFPFLILYLLLVGYSSLSRDGIFLI